MQPGTGDGNYPDKAGCSARAAAGVALLGKRADDTRVYLPASAVVPPDERVPDGKQSVRNDRHTGSEWLLLFEPELACCMGEKSGVHPAGICTKGKAPAAGTGGACRARSLFGAEKGGGAHCRKLWARVLYRKSLSQPAAGCAWLRRNPLSRRGRNRQPKRWLRLRCRFLRFPG